jgi:hypothetical protein
MANYEHVALLKQGVAARNKWREENTDIRPDFSGANIRHAGNIFRADLSGAAPALWNVHDLSDPAWSPLLS